MSSPGVPRTGGGRRSFALIVVSSLIVVGALVVGWLWWSARQEWNRLDTAADAFRVPQGLTEVARPRQGTAACFVTCTSGGEAVVTIVLEADTTDPAEACRVLRAAIVDLTGAATDGGDGDECGWAGELGGSATVFAGAGAGSSFRPHDGHRWTDAVSIPDSPVVAYVEFNSGIE